VLSEALSLEPGRAHVLVRSAHTRYKARVGTWPAVGLLAVRMHSPGYIVYIETLRHTGACKLV
jgi:hypothetical protein